MVSGYQEPSKLEKYAYGGTRKEKKAEKRKWSKNVQQIWKKNGGWWLNKRGGDSKWWNVLIKNN